MNKKLMYIIFIFVFFQAAVVASAFAQGVGSASNNNSSYDENLKRWQNMSEEQREAIRQKVRAMDSGQRAIVLENARQFKQLSPEEQKKIRVNFQKFRALPDAKKELLRERARRFQSFSPEKRAALRHTMREEKEHIEIVRGRRQVIRARVEDRRDLRKDVRGQGLVSDRKPSRDGRGATLRQRGDLGKNFQNRPGVQVRPVANLKQENDNKPSGPHRAVRKKWKKPVSVVPQDGPVGERQGGALVSGGQKTGGN